jgi:hypothetical protein
MGDVILWRPRSQNYKRLSEQMKPHSSHDVGYPTPEDEAAAKTLAAMRRLEIVPEDDGS